MGIPIAQHRATIAHIEAQVRQRGLMGDVRQCGCQRAKDDTWMMCAYHDGYDAGRLDADEQVET